MQRLRVALSAASAVGLALIIAFVTGVSFGQATASAPAGSELGVIVHGDWAVTVKNGDGSVAQEHAFHNDFNGASTLAPILAHQSATGRYWLTLSDAATAQHPCGATAAEACFVFEADDPNAGTTGWFGTLNVTSTASPVAVVVTGTVIATRAGQFNQVRMLLSRCAATTAPSACHPGAYGNFSARTLPAPISVVAGQQILVTVTYTFSAAP